MKKRKKYITFPNLLIYQMPFWVASILLFIFTIFINWPSVNVMYVFLIYSCTLFGINILFLSFCFILRWQRFLAIEKEGIKITKKNEVILCRWSDFETIEKITDDGGKFLHIIKITFKNGEKIYFDYTKSIDKAIETLCDNNDFKTSMKNSNGHFLFAPTRPTTIPPSTRTPGR